MSKKKLFILSLASLLIQVGCTTSQPKDESPRVDDSESSEPPSKISVSKSIEPKKIEGSNRVEFDFNLDELVPKLRLGNRFEQLGFHDKKFSPCAIGIKEAGCTSHYFIMVNFQVVCRDSVDTTESSDHILTPLANRSVELKLGGKTMDSATDDQGFGQLRMVSKKSERNSRFILTANPNYLGLYAREVGKIVVPSDWCN